MAGRYTEALGIRSGHEVKTPLTLQGFGTWAVSKAPAAAGGYFADMVYRKAVEMWPNYKRGADFVGGVAVAAVAYGLQVAMSSWAPNNSHMADKFTDGMIGRYSPIIVNELKSLLGWVTKKDATPGGPQGPAQGTGSLDGDREAIIEVANLLHGSPETTQAMADQMFEIMRRDNVDIDAKGQQGVIRSLRETSRRWAQGAFTL